MKKIDIESNLEYIKSLCSEITKMLDDKELTDTINEKINKSIDNIEDVFFYMIGEEKLSKYRNIKDDFAFINKTNNQDAIFDDVDAKDFVVKKLSSESGDLKWSISNDNVILIPIKETTWKLQYDNQLPISLELDMQYKINKGQYYRVLKGSDMLCLKMQKSEEDFSKEEIKLPSIAESIKYHIDNELTLKNSIFRVGSDAWNEIVSKAKGLQEKGRIRLNEYDKLIISTKA